MYPVYRNKVQGSYDAPKAPVYINNGCGGAHATPYSYWYTSTVYSTSPPLPVWSATRLTLPGYAHCSVSRTELTYSFVGSNEGVVYDSITILKEQNKPSDGLPKTESPTPEPSADEA
eukprot:TRINITY_DN11062_c0_g1_i1.p2 TRINITY_DN11062_c0_g1~~TRINITY_DN11062_c0_g1_i1.p2  ORF type:complete len:117 (-),score=13.26 TRINITY_DN11062_c0_g1_i1:9-359(-)